MPSPISYYSMFNFLDNVAIDKITNAFKIIVGYPDTIAFSTVSILCLLNNISIRKSLLFGDLGGIAYQSLNLIKEAYNRTSANWTKIQSGKYIYHGITAIMCQLTGLAAAITEINYSKHNYFLIYLYIFFGMNMCISSVPLILDTPYHRWSVPDKIKSGNDTKGFQITFFLMLIAPIFGFLQSLYFITKYKKLLYFLFYGNLFISYLTFNEAFCRFLGIILSTPHKYDKFNNSLDLLITSMKIKPKFSNHTAFFLQFCVSFPFIFVSYDIYNYLDITICDTFMQRLNTMNIINTLALNSNAFDVSLLVSKKMTQENFTYISQTRFLLNVLTLSSLVKNPTSIFIHKMYKDNCF